MKKSTIMKSLIKLINTKDSKFTRKIEKNLQ